MDNIVGLKRKAQKLVQKGSYQEAIEHYVMVVESGDMDPYDYVVLGDLLLRVEDKEEAVDRYQQALDSYVTGGLYRNAIALCKRIRRLVPHRLSVQRQLGDLYAAEGLNTEAALHYIEYLERSRGTDEFTENAETVCSSLLEFPLPTYDLVPRLVDIAREVDAADAMAPGVLLQAQRADASGRPDQAESLRQLAMELDPDAVPAVASTRPGTPGPMVEPGAVTLDTVPDPSPVSLDAGDLDTEPSVLDPGPGASATPVDSTGLTFDEGPGVVDLDAPSSGSPEPTSEPESLVLDSHDFGMDSDADGAFDLDDATATSNGDLPMVTGADEDGAFSLDDVNEAPAPVAPSGDDPEALREKADSALARGDSVLAKREYMRAGRAYAEANDSVGAADVYQSVVKLDPNHLDALEALVEIAWESGNQSQMSRFGCDLGDVLLARDRYEEARGLYERVLELDPENPKAQSRVRRLASMAGEDTEETNESMAVVEVRDDAPAPTQTAVDLAAILEEFKESIVDSIPTGDAQSHYDMGMAYKEMGLMDEAVSEYHSASEASDIRPRALEMLGECYLIQARHEDALLVLEELVGGNNPPESEARIRLALGKAMEGLNRQAEAEEHYYRALELNDDLVEAAERLHDMEQKRAGGAS